MGNLSGVFLLTTTLAKRQCGLPSGRD
jgi:hypothetical protein